MVTVTVAYHLHKMVIPSSPSKLAFLCTRPEDQTTATLVACGTAGWVRFWNVYGGGLIGEFNSLDVKRYRLKGSFLKYHSVTACTVKNDDSLMVLGNSLGYLQVHTHTYTPAHTHAHTHMNTHMYTHMHTHAH